MAARPECRTFILEIRHGQLLCARCGLNIIFHPAEVAPQHGDGPANVMFPLDWNAGQMGYRINRQPPPHSNPIMEVNNNNIDNHLPHQLPDGAEDDAYVVDGDDDDLGLSELSSNIFTREQLRLMLDMARSLGWSLRGRARDANLNQFCQDIGVSRLQFSNWLNRNRARFAMRHPQ